MSDMPSTPSKGAVNSGGATQAEAFFLLHVLQNQNGDVKIDWDPVAAAAGLKNAATARARYYQIKKKLGWTDRDAGSPGAAMGPSPTKVEKAKAPKKPRAPRKPKVKKEEPVDQDEEENMEREEAEYLAVKAEHYDSADEDQMERRESDASGFSKDEEKHEI